MINRRKTKKIKLGELTIGGDSPIAVQSMTNTPGEDVELTIRQIRRLQKAGCEIVRVAVPNQEVAQKLNKIKKGIDIPLIADIQFDYRLALIALDKGVDGLRLNPGNIRSKRGIKEVISIAKDKEVPVRIGVNSGSLAKEVLQKFGGPTAEAMVYSALEEIKMMEDWGFDLIKVSLKASEVTTTISAYQKLANLVDYPFHLGITEAGPRFRGGIKSALGLGVLLFNGIGDTIRVSLTTDPVEEVKAGWEILRGLGLRKEGFSLISCPTCGRCEVDLIKIVNDTEKALDKLPLSSQKYLKIAVMGCEVNGPGEAKEADLGIACGKGVGLLFKRGKVIKKIKEKEMVDELLKEIKKELKVKKGE